MKRVYMAHPVRGDVEGNLARARGWVRAIEEQFDVAVECSWITECVIWDDSDEAQRAAGMKRNKAHVERCDELWLVGDRVSSGMLEEANHARAHGIPVCRLKQPDGELLPVALCPMTITLL